LIFTLIIILIYGSRSAKLTFTPRNFCKRLKLKLTRKTEQGISKKFTVRLLEMRFTNAISCFEPGPEEPYREIFWNTQKWPTCRYPCLLDPTIFRISAKMHSTLWVQP
jgi:hypothetical protein